jgi:transposase-like protein
MTRDSGEWLTDFEVTSILRRQEAIERHQPVCPGCNSSQIQIMNKKVPARWRCRRCRQWFNSEPKDTPTHDQR